MTRTRIALLLAAAATPLLTGCVDGTMTIPTVTSIGATAAAPASAYAMARSINYGEFGPRVHVSNLTDDAVAVRVWVGTVDAFEPMGVRDIRTNDELSMVVEPGVCECRRAERRAWPTAIYDAVIWVQAARADGEGQTHWIALERGGPFEVTLIDTPAGLAFDAEHTSPFGPVPTDRRIVGRLGEHPVWDHPDGAG